MAGVLEIIVFFFAGGFVLGWATGNLVYGRKNCGECFIGLIRGKYCGECEYVPMISGMLPKEVKER